MNAIQRARLHVISLGQVSSAEPRHRAFQPEEGPFSPLRRRREAGATLVEFALVVMVLMVMVLGVVDFSRALYVYHFVDHAAKSATRWAAVNGYTCSQDGSCPYGATGSQTNNVYTYVKDCGVGTSIACGATASDVQSYVLGLVPDGINRGQITTSVSWPVESSTSTDPSPAICSGAVSGLSTGAIPNYPGCTVEVQVSYPFNFLYPFVQNATITLSSTSEMVIAH